MHLSRLFLSALGIIIIATEARGGRNIYVSQTGGADHGEGDQNAPYKTIQHAVNQSHYGDVILIKKGIYREQIFISSASWVGEGRYMAATDPYFYRPIKPNGPDYRDLNAPLPLTIKAWDTGDSERPVITAFQSLTSGWGEVTDPSLLRSLTGRAEGANVEDLLSKVYVRPWVFGPLPSIPQLDPDPNAPPPPESTIHTVMEGNSGSVQFPLKQTGWNPGYSGVSNLQEYMVEGSFRFDPPTASSSGLLYVWRRDGCMPDLEHPIEAMDPTLSMDVFPEPVVGFRGPFFSQVSWISLENLVFRGSNCTSTFVPGGVVMQYGSSLKNCDIQWMDSDGVYGYSLKIHDCTISNNGRTGGSTPPTGIDYLQIENSRIQNNNWRNFDPDHHAGGIKSIFGDDVSDLGIRIKNNVVSDNFGPGIWFDFVHGGPENDPSRRGVISGNYVARNKMGIFLEGSSRFDVVNNLIVNNDLSGVVMRACRDNKVTFNTIISRFQDSVHPTPPTCFSLSAEYRGNTLDNVVEFNVMVQYLNASIAGVFENHEGSFNLYQSGIEYPVFYKGNQVRNNLFFSPPPLTLGFTFFRPENDGIKKTLGYLQGQSSSGFSNNISVNPGFVGWESEETTEPPGKKEFEPQWNSPVKNFVEASDPSHDYTQRQRRGRRDLGAIEVPDVDGDGLDDSWEEEHTLEFLGSKDLEYFNGSVNIDGDAYTDSEENFWGTDPFRPNPGGTVTFYVNFSLGDNTWDGLLPNSSPYKRGPRRQIKDTLMRAVAGDTVRVASGTYPEGSLDISDKQIHLIIDGNVNLQ